MFQGKNEKVEFSQYHCKENTRKSTRQMKLSTVEKPPASSQETWVADLVWPQEITKTQPYNERVGVLIISSLFSFSVIFVFKNRVFSCFDENIQSFLAQIMIESVYPNAHWNEVSCEARRCSGRLAGWLPLSGACWFYSDACLSVQSIIARIKKIEEEIESSYLAGLLKV